jgi:hypothetical protein
MPHAQGILASVQGRTVGFGTGGCHLKNSHDLFRVKVSLSDMHFNFCKEIESELYQNKHNPSWQRTIPPALNTLLSIPHGVTIIESEHFPMGLISCLSSGGDKIREAELRMQRVARDGDLPTLNKDIQFSHNIDKCDSSL